MMMNTTTTILESNNFVNDDEYRYNNFESNNFVHNDEYQQQQLYFDYERTTTTSLDYEAITC